jgi:hypothetical protein
MGTRFGATPTVRDSFVFYYRETWTVSAALPNLCHFFIHYLAVIMAGDRAQAVRKREQSRVVCSGLTLEKPVTKHRHLLRSADVLGHRETPASQLAFPITRFAALGWCVIRTAL